MKKYNLIHYNYDDYKITKETKRGEFIVKEFQSRQSALNFLRKVQK